MRGPETGLVTVRGRIGGGGAPSISAKRRSPAPRCGCRPARSATPIALGRDKEKVRLAAILDALWQ